MLRRTLFVLLLLACMLMGTTAAEEKKDEWKDNSYNFKAMKTVAVQVAIDESVKLNAGDLEKINALVTANILNDKKLKGILTQAKPESPQNSADAVLAITIRQFGRTDRFVKESTRIVTHTEAIVIDTPNGPRQILMPAPTEETTPAHYEHDSHAGAEFMLTDSKTRQKVWTLLDLRDAKNSTKPPIDMTERIFERAVDMLQQLIQ